MKNESKEILLDLIQRYPSLSSIKINLFEAVEIMISSFVCGGKLLVCGNGGSASDSLHIVGELMKDFSFPRPLEEEFISQLREWGEEGEYISSNLQKALPAIALVGSSALETAYANDRAPDLSFAQMVNGLGKMEDVLLAITTSGNSRNVIYASIVAKSKGMKVISLTGEGGGKMKKYSDVLLSVPEKETYKVQELHLPLYHAICLALEKEFFG